MDFLMEMARNGNPQQAQGYIESLVSNGTISQSQLEQYKQQAQMLGKMFGLI